MAPRDDRARRSTRSRVRGVLWLPVGLCGLDLYYRGQVFPVARLDSHHNATPVWTYGAHPNPVFSRDGTRVYFVRGADDGRAQATAADISGIVENFEVEDY